METVLIHFEGLAQLGVLLGMLGMTLLTLVAFALYLFVLPSSIQVYAPLLDGPARTVPKADPAPGDLVIPAQTTSGARA
ncbi:MAG: hypothetical protein LAP13_02725 [Acidobacteriia bacterium]|nr:hypothetical protein [Terriglobia bacterium]